MFCNSKIYIPYSMVAFFSHFNHMQPLFQEPKLCRFQGQSRDGKWQIHTYMYTQRGAVTKSKAQKNTEC